ncbi:MAG TPA: hypothetical protein VF856_03810 [Gemmatimonadaceae bacterium]
MDRTAGSHSLAAAGHRGVRLPKEERKAVDFVGETNEGKANLGVAVYTVGQRVVATMEREA